MQSTNKQKKAFFSEEQIQFLGRFLPHYEEFKGRNLFDLITMTNGMKLILEITYHFEKKKEFFVKDSEYEMLLKIIKQIIVVFNDQTTKKKEPVQFGPESELLMMKQKNEEIALILGEPTTKHFSSEIVAKLSTISIDTIGDLHYSITKLSTFGMDLSGLIHFLRDEGTFIEDEIISIVQVVRTMPFYNDIVFLAQETKKKRPIVDVINNYKR